jgi:hypothetical protein
LTLKSIVFGPAVQPLVARLLGTTRIVPDLSAATDAWHESHGALHFVTHSGELLSRQRPAVFDVEEMGRQAAALIPRHNIVGRMFHDLGTAKAPERLAGDVAEADAVAVSDETGPGRHATLNQRQRVIASRGGYGVRFVEERLVQRRRSAAPFGQLQGGGQ